jgi:hypothetical protein
MKDKLTKVLSLTQEKFAPSPSATRFREAAPGLGPVSSRLEQKSCFFCSGPIFVTVVLM